MQDASTKEIEISSTLINMTEEEAVKTIVQFDERNKPICFILAKRRSKRLPNKNRLKLNDKTLVIYPIEVALKSGLFKTVIVSSDSLDILEMSYEAGAMLHKRPIGLCTDKTQMKHVVKYLVEIYECDSFCVLTPCNPFVTSEDLINGYKMLIEKKANYVLSVIRTSPVEYALKLKDGFIEPRMLKRSQEYETTYYCDGGFIFARSEAFEHEWDLGFYGTRCTLYETPHKSVDIDTQEDFDYAKYLMGVK
jgi:CMP-N-acetylneuraminic acid synthetase